jgi:hypothetical protein
MVRQILEDWAALRYGEYRHGFMEKYHLIAKALAARVLFYLYTIFCLGKDQKYGWRLVDYKIKKMGLNREHYRPGQHKSMTSIL